MRCVLPSYLHGAQSSREVDGCQLVKKFPDIIYSEVVQRCVPEQSSEPDGSGAYRSPFLEARP